MDLASFSPFFQGPRHPPVCLDTSKVFSTATPVAAPQAEPSCCLNRTDVLGTHPEMFLSPVDLPAALSASSSDLRWLPRDCPAALQLLAADSLFSPPPLIAPRFDNLLLLAFAMCRNDSFFWHEVVLYKKNVPFPSCCPPVVFLTGQDRV